MRVGDRLAELLLENGVNRVFGVPGGQTLPLYEGISEFQDVHKELGVPLNRLAQPDDIARVMEFFVTDLGDYVTGQNISVCGGAINF